MLENYRDEHEKESDGGVWAKNPNYLDEDVWGDYGGDWDNDDDVERKRWNGIWNYPSIEKTWKQDLNTISGYLLVDRDGKLVWCDQYCNGLPSILVYLKCEDNRYDHSDCVCIKAGDDRKISKYGMLVWNQKDNMPALVLSMTIPENESKVVLRCGWQKGHDTYSNSKKMKFQIYGVEVGWRSYPLGGFADVAEIDVDKNGVIKVNGKTGSLTGNMETVKKYAKN